MEIQEIINLIYEALKTPIGYLVSPAKRVYLPYLLTSFTLAFFVFLKLKQKNSFFKYLFNKKVWLSRSARIDYYLALFNGFVKIIIIAPFVIYTVYAAYGINDFLVNQFGEASIQLTATQTVVYYTFAMLFIGDFMSFFIHYLLHKIPFLWEFHKIHHSALVLNPFTQYRIHPIEFILQNIRGIVVKGCVTGVFIYLSVGEVTLLTFLGISVFDFLFLVSGASLRHSHVPFKYPKWLEFFIISPYQHQIHHSNKQELYDTNMGSKLAIWDWLFGTLVRSKSVKHLTFGLGKREDKQYATFTKNLILPFLKIIKKIRN